ncbi:MAG TPA: hypothetical protein VGN07_04445 [Steroidobacteraceae bacterium]|jgi:hypothetical protein
MSDDDGVADAARDSDPGFPKTLMSRLNLIRHAFSDVLPDSLAQILEQFRRDAYPERELSVWEAMAAVYQDFKELFKPDAARCRTALLVLLELSMNRLRPRTRKRWIVLSEEEFMFLRTRWEVFGSCMPVVETKQLH